ncbi:hypothetical protein NKH61_34950, partial [Mesorhizobium sp. M1005]
GAPMKNLAHSASFDSDDKDAPSKPGIKHLVDGGPVRIPESGSYVKENGVSRWLIEGEGIRPDIYVENDPYLFYHGYDKQLRAAVDYLMH